MADPVGEFNLKNTGISFNTTADSQLQQTVDFEGTATGFGAVSWHPNNHATTRRGWSDRRTVCLGWESAPGRQLDLGRHRRGDVGTDR